MKKIKGILAITLASLMAVSIMSGCSNDDNSSDATASAKEIYYLNFKPEIANKYKEIADEYKQKTGVTVKIVTAASGGYESTLKSEIAKTDAPTIFQVNGPVGFNAWKDYCADLSDWELYKDLTDEDLAIKNGDGVYGIPYSIEGYGIIYNNSIMKKYFELEGKKANISSVDEIKNFATLKSVVEDMTANKDKLGIKGVFSSTSMKSGEQWRFTTHLADVPFYYEFAEDKEYADTIQAGLNAKTITFKYNKNFQNLFDLYLDNSVTDRKLVGSKATNDSMSEFALGQTAMVQNGNWAWNEIKDTQGNVVTADDIKYLPLYTGITDEEKQGICVGTENYLAINSKASEEKQKASREFLEWLFTSSEGKAHVKNDLGFIAPFSTFGDAEKPEDPLAKEVINWTAKEDITNIPWTFQSFPSENFKNEFGSGLLSYAQGKEEWSAVTDNVISAWKNERAS